MKAGTSESQTLAIFAFGGVHLMSISSETSVIASVLAWSALYSLAIRLGSKGGSSITQTRGALSFLSALTLMNGIFHHPNDLLRFLPYLNQL
jgi:hypothetical protein